MKRLESVAESMLKIGLIGFGGGNALIPVIEKEFVEDKGLLSKEEFDEEVIVASITPGALPVEIACGIGHRLFDRKGMIATTTLMALPGVFLCILCLVVLTGLQESVLNKILWYSFGINIFIVYMLFEFVVRIIRQSKERNRVRQDVIICLIIFLLTGKSKVAALFNLDWKWKMDLSILSVLFLTFFYLLYVKSDYSKKRARISYVIGGSYFVLSILPMGMRIEWLLAVVQLVMVALSVYGVYGNIKSSKVKRSFQWSDFAKDEIAWIIFLVLLSLPAFFVFSGAMDFSVKGLLSSFISYGGGDAYLSIAQGMFVDGGMISSENFYGRLVCIANVLPGSILCKILAGIGFFVGKEATESVIGGILVALSGFAISVFGSASVFLLIHYFFDCYEDLKCFKILKIWTRPIIAGLLIPVAISLLTENLKLVQNDGHSIGFAWLLVVILVTSIEFFNRKTKLPFLVKIIFLGVLGRIFLGV